MRRGSPDLHPVVVGYLILRRGLAVISSSYHSDNLLEKGIMYTGILDVRPSRTKRKIKFSFEKKKSLVRSNYQLIRTPPTLISPQRTALTWGNRV
jgi:hypothetical protein